MSEVERLKKLDNVKWILTLLIVLYHIQYPFQEDNQKTAFMFVKNLGDCVVPAFSLISGFLFFSNIKNTSCIKKMKHRVLTLLIPYLLWNTLNVIFVYVMNVGIRGVINRDPLEVNIYEDIIIGNASPHFWYIYMLMFWSLFAPILYAACKDRRILAVLLLSQVVYIAYMGNDILHSRFIYILYTWGGIIGYYKPDLFYKIDTGWSSKMKVKISICLSLVYFGISFFFVFFDMSMGIKVWLYAIKGVSLIFATINLPLLKIGKLTGFKYSFWIFAVHYWLDTFLGRYILPYVHENALLYQFYLWMLVVIIGLSSGVFLNKVLPKVFAILTGGRVGENYKQNQILNKETV